MTDGPLPAEDVKRQAKANAISEPTLRRAKKLAGVEARKLGFGDGAKWVWELPGASKMLTDTEGAHPLDVSAFDESERLREEGAE